MKARVAAANIDEHQVREAYRRWAPTYDRTFGLIANAGRRHAVEIINKRRG
jgi:phosphatidylethanolamine/phosphatidyl-N-methylethanolamine N-methyltransferase